MNENLRTQLISKKAKAVAVDLAQRAFHAEAEAFEFLSDLNRVMAEISGQLSGDIIEEGLGKDSILGRTFVCLGGVGYACSEIMNTLASNSEWFARFPQKIGDELPRVANWIANFKTN